MKKVLILFLTALLLLGLCACGAEPENSEVATTVADDGGKAPSDEMIREDVSGKLATKNQYATLCGVETVKSLTNEGTYEITLNIMAETKYADWVYEAKLEYTKYDQGWMLDDLDWLQEAYTVTGEPTGEEIAAILNEMFADTDALYGGWEYAFPVENGSVIPSESDSENLCFTWTTTIELMHAKYDMDMRSSWHYSAASDSWALDEVDDLEALKDKYAVYFTEGTPEIVADFTGEWVSAGGSTITISDFTANGFTAKMDGKAENFERWSTQGRIVVYGGEDHKITLGFNDDKSTIMRSDFLNNVDFFAQMEELPALEK